MPVSFHLSQTKESKLHTPYFHALIDAQKKDLAPIMSIDNSRDPHIHATNPSLAHLSILSARTIASTRIAAPTDVAGGATMALVAVVVS